MGLLDNARPMSAVANDVETLKLFIYGQYSTGKTHLALNAPGPILFIDTEQGTKPFLKRPEFAFLIDPANKNKLVHSGDVGEVVQLLKEIAIGKGKGFGTVVIDSLTTLYYNLQNAHLGKQGKPETADWNIIKLAWKDLLIALSNTPTNVVACAQEKNGVKGAKVNGFMKYEQEITFDCDDSTPFFADLALRFTRSGTSVTGEVIKEDRFGRYKPGKPVQAVTFDKLLLGMNKPAAAAMPAPAPATPAPAPIAGKVSAVEPTPADRALLDELENQFVDLLDKEAVKAHYDELKKEYSGEELTALQSVFSRFYRTRPASAALVAAGLPVSSAV